MKKVFQKTKKATEINQSPFPMRTLSFDITPNRLDYLSSENVALVFQ